MMGEWDQRANDDGAYENWSNGGYDPHSSENAEFRRNFLIFSVRQPYSSGLKVFSYLNLVWSGFWILIFTIATSYDAATGAEPVGFMIFVWIFAVLIFAGPTTLIQYLWQAHVKDRELMRRMEWAMRSRYPPYPHPNFPPYQQFQGYPGQYQGPYAHPYRHEEYPPQYGDPYPQPYQYYQGYPDSYQNAYTHPYHRHQAYPGHDPYQEAQYPPEEMMPPGDPSTPSASPVPPQRRSFDADTRDRSATYPVPAPPKKRMNDLIGDDDDTLERARSFEAEGRYDEAMVLYEELGYIDDVDRVVTKVIDGSKMREGRNEPESWQ